MFAFSRKCLQQRLVWSSSPTILWDHRTRFPSQSLINMSTLDIPLNISLRISLKRCRHVLVSIHFFCRWFELLRDVESCWDLLSAPGSVCGRHGGHLISSPRLPDFIHPLSTLYPSFIHPLSTIYPSFIQSSSTLYQSFIHPFSTLYPPFIHPLSILFPSFIHPFFHPLSILFPPFTHPLSILYPIFLHPLPILYPIFFHPSLPILFSILYPSTLIQVWF